MSFRLAADLVLLLHLVFILFAVLGGTLTIWWRWTPILHLPLSVWSILVEFTGCSCPLTFLENDLRIKAGQSGYTESFVEHYLLAIIYPTGLTREFQYVLAGVVIAINTAIYGFLLFRKRVSH
jgi:hypothetical protein